MLSSEVLILDFFIPKTQMIFQEANFFSTLIFLQLI